jgi:replication factor A1
MNQLSAGIITRLLNSDPDDSDLFNGGHVVQLLSARLMPQQTKNPTHDRYRLMISDSLHYTSAMLATQMNHIFANGAMLNCAILKVNKFSCSFVQGKR